MSIQSIPGGAKIMTKGSLLPSRTLLYATLLVAFLLRMCLFSLTHLSETLQDRPELSTPINSWKALLEAHYLFHQTPSSTTTHTLPGGLQGPYAVGSVHHSPLLLPLLRYPLDQFLRAGDALPVSLIWSLADVMSGWFLFQMCLQRDISHMARQTHLWPWDQSRATKVSALLLFNPYTIATCLARSTASLEMTMLLAAVYSAMSASTLLLSIFWTISSLLSLYPVLLLPQLIQLSIHRAGELVYEREVSRVGSMDQASNAKHARQLGFLVDRIRYAKRSTWLKSLILSPAAFAGGLWISRAIALSPGDARIASLIVKLPHVLRVPLDQGWSWTEQVYGSTLLMTDLTPNLGLWWYFFMEIFDHFRNFFLLTFNVHVASYALPFLIKYKQDPLFGITLMCGVIAVFKSYPTLGDHGLFLGLLSIHSQIFEYMRYPLVSTLTYVYCTFLSPAFHHLWLTAGSANANFFYAITLVWALGGGMLVLDAMWGWGRERWEKERTPIRSRSQRNIPLQVPAAQEAIATPEAESDVVTPKVGVAEDAALAHDVGVDRPKRIVVQV